MERVWGTGAGSPDPLPLAERAENSASCSKEIILMITQKGPRRCGGYTSSVGCADTFPSRGRQGGGHGLRAYTSSVRLRRPPSPLGEGKKGPPTSFLQSQHSFRQSHGLLNTAVIVPCQNLKTRMKKSVVVFTRIDPRQTLPEIVQRNFRIGLVHHQTV